MLLVNLRMDAVHVKESMRINWVAEGGIKENIALVTKEYKDARALQVSTTWQGQTLFLDYALSQTVYPYTYGNICL